MYMQPMANSIEPQGNDTVMVDASWWYIQLLINGFMIFKILLKVRRTSTALVLAFFDLNRHFGHLGRSG